jgi:hypothetical protein
MLIDDLKNHIETTINTLSNRVQTAADLSELVRTKQLPSSPQTVFVLPLGLRALSPAEVSANSFEQMLVETFGILIVVRNQNDATGGKALHPIETIVDALIANIAGWTPDDTIGVFSIARGQLISAAAGLVMYQLDFSIQTQVRNIT